MSAPEAAHTISDMPSAPQRDGQPEHRFRQESSQQSW
jgi:hypothetical protein